MRRAAPPPPERARRRAGGRATERGLRQPNWRSNPTLQNEVPAGPQDEVPVERRVRARAHRYGSGRRGSPLGRGRSAQPSTRPGPGWAADRPGPGDRASRRHRATPALAAHRTRTAPVESAARRGRAAGSAGSSRAARAARRPNTRHSQQRIRSQAVGPVDSRGGALPAAYRAAMSVRFRRPPTTTIGGVVRTSTPGPTSRLCMRRGSAPPRESTGPTAWLRIRCWSASYSGVARPWPPSTNRTARRPPRRAADSTGAVSRPMSCESRCGAMRRDARSPGPGRSAAQPGPGRVDGCALRPRPSESRGVHYRTDAPVPDPRSTGTSSCGRPGPRSGELDLTASFGCRRPRSVARPPARRRARSRCGGAARRIARPTRRQWLEWCLRPWPRISRSRPHHGRSLRPRHDGTVWLPGQGAGHRRRPAPGRRRLRGPGPGCGRRRGRRRRRSR